MAIWQYTFYILPKVGIDILAPNRQFKNEGGFDDEYFWKLNPINRVFFEAINMILPKNKSWSDKIDLYGNQESNCLEILIENEDVISASFRIDFTSDYEPILNGILEFLIHNGLIIIDESLEEVLLNFETVKEVIHNSPQFKRYKELLRD